MTRTFNISYKVPAVVLGLDVNGLGHIRSLALKGIKVIGIYTNCEELGRFSRLCKPIKFPDAKKNREKFKEALIRLGKSLHNKAVLFATNDFYVEFISDFREELQLYYLFTFPEKNFLKNLINKDKMKEIAQQAGLQVPKTFLLSSNKDITRVAKIITYPCLIKPLDSFSIKFPKKNIIINDNKSLINFYKENPQFMAKTIVQELIGGGDQNIFQCTTYFNKNSIPIFAFTMQKIRQYPPYFGITSFGVSRTVPELIKQTITFLKNVNYKGFASVEFKWDEKRQKYFFIEINPRLPWYNSLFTASGVNFPYIAYLDHTSSCILKNKMPRQIDGVYWLNFRVDIGSFWRRRKLGDKISLSQWLQSIFCARSFAYWHKKDPLPFCWASLDFLNFLGSKFVENLTKYL